MENRSNFETLIEKNFALRKQRLALHNLISVAGDEVMILKILLKSQKKIVLNAETQEFFEILLKSHEEYVEKCCEYLSKETALIEKNGGGKDTEFYILEIEQIMREKIHACEFILNIIRAMRLSY